MTSSEIVLCLEDTLYRRYLEQSFADAAMPIASVQPEDLAQTIAERLPGVLLLQSNSAELGLIELSSKLKRLLGDDICTVLLSADYLTAEEAGNAVDVFLQYPAPFDAVRQALAGMGDKRRRVLLIDDSKLVHKTLVPPLEEHGYEISEAFDGAEGLAKAKELRPELIICDIEMPKMNGFEVCSAIRQTEEIADTYIIMSSTLGSAADQQKGFESGVDEYITKPVVVPELLDRIDKVFRAARVGRESIIILEDDDQLAKSIAKSLNKQGFTTRVTGTIKDTLRLARRLAFDLVIATTDLADGMIIDLFQALKALAGDRQPDVLITTSRDSLADQKMVMNAGATSVISKPFSMDSLLASVERALADRRAAQEKAQLEKYVSKASMRMAFEKSILSGKKAAARAYRRQATIFFSDVADFTARCERYEPSEVVTQINAMFEVMTRVIMAHGGDIDKFIGDACMAFWLDDDPKVSAERAIRATLQFRRELEVMNQRSAMLMADPLHIRVGVNTGEIILCDLGSADARIDLSVIGDHVNIAARLESACKQYGVDNLISGFTLDPLLDRFAARLIDRVRVKGKKEPVACYELLDETGITSEQQKELMAVFSRAMAAYEAGEFEPAATLFEAADGFERRTDAGALNPSRLFRKRCRLLQDDPPDHWDGVWKLMDK